MATRKTISGQAAADRVALVVDVRKTTSDEAVEVMEQQVALHPVADLVVETGVLVEEMAVVMESETEVVMVALDLTKIATTKDHSIVLPVTLAAIIAQRDSHSSSMKITILNLPTSKYYC